MDRFTIILIIGILIILAPIVVFIVQIIRKNGPLKIAKKDEKKNKTVLDKEQKEKAKAELKAAIQAKKAEWKEEDRIADEAAKKNVEALKVQIAELKVRYEEVKKEYEANKNDALITQKYLTISKEYELLLQRYRIEKHRISLSYKLERFSKRGGRLRRE